MTYTEFLHGQVISFDEIFPALYKKAFWRDMVEIMSHGRVQYTLADLYLVGQYKNINQFSMALLFKLFGLGACVPFRIHNNQLVIEKEFPSVEKRNKQKYNFIVACSSDVWDRINTCRKARDPIPDNVYEQKDQTEDYELALAISESMGPKPVSAPAADLTNFSKVLSNRSALS